MEHGAFARVQTNGGIIAAGFIRLYCCDRNASRGYHLVVNVDAIASVYELSDGCGLRLRDEPPRRWHLARCSASEMHRWMVEALQRRAQGSQP